MAEVFLFSKGCIRDLHSYSQDSIRDSVLSIHKENSRNVKSLFKNSQIEKRHSIFRDLHNADQNSINFNSLLSLTTKERNDLYKEYAPRMFESAARSLFSEMEHFETSDITHVITASCTGCYSPGPGDELIKSLNLNLTVERLHIGYMGCYAGLAMVRAAHATAISNPEAVVLIVAAEISSLHWNGNTSQDNLLSLSLFSDGSAASIVSQKKFRKSFSIIALGSDFIPDTENQMGWNMGETGFEMCLSRSVPETIEMNVSISVHALLSHQGFTIPEIKHWAIHPGGAKILQLIESKLSFDHEAISASWEVLKNYGNMSSTTIFFVLNSILEKTEKDSLTYAMAFGPGLTVEKLLLKASD